MATSSSFELADLLRIPVWLLAKPAYSFAPISLHYHLANAKGTTDFLRSTTRDSVVAALDRHLGEEKSSDELRAIARRHLQFRRRTGVARLWPQIRSFAGSDSIKVDGLQHLDDALSQGRGAVLVSTHFGYARLIKPILRSRGRRALLVGPRPGRSGPENYPPFYSRTGDLIRTRLLRLPRAASFDKRWHDTVGVDLAIGMNLRPHLAALSRNEALIILADGRAAQALHTVRVLGVEVYLAPGAFSLARRAKAPALPVFVVDDPKPDNSMGFQLVVHPPLDLQITDDTRADLEVNLRRFAAVFEEQARANPHNWHWTWIRDGVLDNPRPHRNRG